MTRRAPGPGRLLPALSLASLASLATLATLPCCSRFGPLYPPRPQASEAAPVADPEPARVVVHLAVSSEGLRGALDDVVPRSGGGTVPLPGGERAYTWQRAPLDLALTQGRVELRTRVQGTLALPLKTLTFPLDVMILAEPVVSAAYAVRLQGVEVHVTSPDGTLSLADKLAGVYGKIEAPIAEQLRSFSQDLRPLLGEAAERIAAPIDLDIGGGPDAGGPSACARLKVLEIEAGPTVLAGGLEKDVALVVAPSITMPCPVLNLPDRPELPPLSNVASLQSGPFTVVVPIAARYDELTRAMGLAFTGGKLFFSKEYPDLYLEKPEVYESDRVLVLKLHIAGPVRGLGIETDLDGDLYLSGHPAVIDNELSVPDLEPTIETTNLLLSLKAMTGAATIRDEARKALRLDLGARLREAQSPVGKGLTFARGGGCMRADLDRVVVSGVYPHAAYLRIYASVTARARLEMPCQSASPAD